MARHGLVSFHHYDFYAQALAKIERGHAQDLEDVAALHRLELIEPDTLLRLFEAIASQLVRYPALDPPTLRRQVERTVAELLA